MLYNDNNCGDRSFSNASLFATPAISLSPENRERDLSEDYDVDLPAFSLRHTRDLILNGYVPIDWLIPSFVEWSKEPTYLLFRKTILNPNPFCLDVDYEYYCVKAAKRGNDVYRERVEERFREFSRYLGKKRFFDRRDKRGIKLTKAFLITLEFDSNRIGLMDAWRSEAKIFNSFMIRLRRFFGKFGSGGYDPENRGYAKCKILRVNEAHESGYPHIHVLVYLDRFVPVKWHRGKKGKGKGNWRLANKKWKDMIADLWEYGYVDVVGVADMRDARDYLMKYLKKAVETVEENDEKGIKTMAYCWLFRKRAFSFSKGWDEEPYILLLRLYHHQDMKDSIDPIERETYREWLDAFRSMIRKRQWERFEVIQQTSNWKEYMLTDDELVECLFTDENKRGCITQQTLDGESINLIEIELIGCIVIIGTGEKPPPIRFEPDENLVKRAISLLADKNRISVTF